MPNWRRYTLAYDEWATNGRRGERSEPTAGGLKSRSGKFAPRENGPTRLRSHRYDTDPFAASFQYPPG
jgi:hypothetical protein